MSRTLRATSRAVPSDLLPESLRPQPGHIRTIAHRGDSSSAPENTIAAFDAAVAAGCDLIEIDVRIAADGVPVIIHDGSALRTTGIAADVARTSSDTLRAADAGSWFGPGFAGARVPTLAEVAEWGAAHPDVGWLVEFKGGWSAAQMDGPVATIRRHGLAGRTILQGFETETVAAARDVAPDLPRALLVYRPEHLDGLRACRSSGPPAATRSASCPSRCPASRCDCGRPATASTRGPSTSPTNGVRRVSRAWTA
jgi:glycerophosphoryl diester phosphodiesterase